MQEIVVNATFQSGDYKDEKWLMMLTFNSLGVSGGRETIEERAGGGRNSGIGEAEDLRGRGRLIDGVKLEVMRRYSEYAAAGI